MLLPTADAMQPLPHPCLHGFLVVLALESYLLKSRGLSDGGCVFLPLLQARPRKGISGIFTTENFHY